MEPADDQMLFALAAIALGVWAIALFMLVGMVELLVAHQSIKMVLDAEERREPEPAPEYQGPDVGR